MLIDEKKALRRAMPRLASLLAESSLLELERLDAGTLCAWFREFGEPGFLIPEALGGRGRSLSELAPICSAIAAACPSLAVMMLMHHHTVGAFCLDEIPLPRARDLLSSVAQERRLVGSAFAESRNVDLLDSSVTCRPENDGFRLDGRKKPCTMSREADLFLVGVIDHVGQERSRGLAFAERSESRIATEPFWTREVLRATGSDALVFDDTRIPAGNVLLPTAGEEGYARRRLAVAQSEITISMIFQTLMASSYLGVAARLCGIALAKNGDDTLMFLTCELEAARYAQYRLAQQMGTGVLSAGQLAMSMAFSYNAIRRIDALVTEFEARPPLHEDEECRYLASVCGFMKRHPPSEAMRHSILANRYLPG